MMACLRWHYIRLWLLHLKRRAIPTIHVGFLVSKWKWMHSKLQILFTDNKFSNDGLLDTSKSMELVETRTRKICAPRGVFDLKMNLKKEGLIKAIWNSLLENILHILNYMANNKKWVMTLYMYDTQMSNDELKYLWVKS